MSFKSSWRACRQQPIAKACLIGTIVTGSVGIVGCEKPEEKVVQSKFEVDEGSSSGATESSAAKPAASPAAKETAPAPTANVATAPQPTAPASPAAATPAPAGSTASAPAAGSNSATPAASAPAATPLPSFSPTLTQNTDTRSFAALKKPEQADAKGWMEFLAKTDVAMRELMMGVQARQVSEPDFMKYATNIDKMKLEASEALLAMAQTGPERDAGLLGKLQALSQMAGLNDPKAADDLRAFASEIAKIESPDAAHQANVVMAMFYLADYATGKIKDSKPILDQMDKAWADKKYVSMPDLRMASEILSTFQQSGDMAAFDSARAKTIAALGDSENLQVAGTVWQLQVMSSKEFANLRQELEGLLSGTVDVPTERLKVVLDELVKTYPSQMTYAFIAKQSIDIEYAGFVPHAKVMNDMVKASIDVIKNAEIKSDVERLIQDFDKRAAVLGSQLTLEGLKKMDGQPLDWSAYQGKVVLVDIWATWCKPCVEEFPTMRNIYQQFKDKGFEIVGVSVDEEAAELQAFVQKEQLPWTIAFSADPQKMGFETPIAKSLGVTAIPFLVLVDRTGKVVGMHKRGKALEQAVAELIQQ